MSVEKIAQGANVWERAFEKAWLEVGKEDEGQGTDGLEVG